MPADFPDVPRENYLPPIDFMEEGVVPVGI
jgi:hypothetical protein